MLCAVVAEPIARLCRLLTPEGSPARESGAALQQSLGHSAVDSSAGSFLSARSDSLSEASSWVSGKVLPGQLQAPVSDCLHVPRPYMIEVMLQQTGCARGYALSSIAVCTAAEEQEPGQEAATAPASRRSRRNLTAALLIDSPSVFGPLPDPCSSPTFRKLSDPNMRGALQQDAPQRPPGGASGVLLRRLSGGRSKGAESSAPSLTAGSLRSYSSGMVPVLDSVSSMLDDAELVPTAAAAGSSSGDLPPKARILLKRAAVVYSGTCLHATHPVTREASSLQHQHTRHVIGNAHHGIRSATLDGAVLCSRPSTRSRHARTASGPPQWGARP